MKRIITLLAIMFTAIMPLTAQEKEQQEEIVINHTVELGETVLMICKKYVVLPKDFYVYNKEAIHGIKTNEVLRIPLHKSKKKNIKDLYKQQDGAYANVSSGKSEARTTSP